METEEENTQSNQQIKINMKVLTEHYNRLQLENSKMDKLLNTLNVNKDVINRVADNKAKSDDTTLEKAMVDLTLKEMQRKQSNYIAKMNIRIKAYKNRNKAINSEIALIKRQLDSSKACLDDFHALSKEELAGLEVKEKRYEGELIKFQKKYPWLSDPTLDLLELNNEITSLRKLRTQCSNLHKEFEEYRGLKPDIFEASQQLAEVKLQHQQFKL